MTNSDSANCDSSSNSKVFHCCHLCSYTILIISAICCLPPRKSVKGTSTLSKNPRLLGYWELIREAVYQPFLFSFWNDSHHKPHTFTPWGGESLCVACLSRPIRPTPFSLYIHIFIYILKLKPGGIKKGESTVQHLWMNPDDEQASS